MGLLVHISSPKNVYQNGFGEAYEPKWRDSIEQMVGDYVNHEPVPTCLRNHAFLKEVEAGGGPIRMVTKEAFKDLIRKLWAGKTSLA